MSNIVLRLTCNLSLALFVPCFALALVAMPVGQLKAEPLPGTCADGSEQVIDPDTGLSVCCEAVTVEATRTVANPNNAAPTVALPRFRCPKVLCNLNSRTCIINAVLFPPCGGTCNYPLTFGCNCAILGGLIPGPCGCL